MNIINYLKLKFKTNKAIKRIENYKESEEVMVLDLFDRKLIYGLKRQEIFKLSFIETRTLVLLSDNGIHSQEEIRDYAKINSTTSARHIIYQLRKKIPCLEIETHNCLGYKLNSIIKIK